ncbi:uncharacterized protein LACBIDRAFT_335306 [Laccaria bicolor S238N-H82]|uniref:Predicted protein n=1 Tax=Laccaria bicolor (strain S238N-H82 / ATCC MYA-4686) TaxID=486041 RepID=B0E1Y7_LACBS|nr:uncharacterized protein LACBIDRAFT_335306 [Laccaria bicolor S238N-H82]EDQ99148.1 predicted protein [Laccaria bicolor S238N-H82]|eukprot:XP_001890211.1 predicted protein [Laccaria bicolor S238N-H82]
MANASPIKSESTPLYLPTPYITRWITYVERLFIMHKWVQVGSEDTEVAGWYRYHKLITCLHALPNLGVLPTYPPWELYDTGYSLAYPNFEIGAFGVQISIKNKFLNNLGVFRVIFNLTAAHTPGPASLYVNRIIFRRSKHFPWQDQNKRVDTPSCGHRLCCKHCIVNRGCTSKCTYMYHSTCTCTFCFLHLHLSIFLAGSGCKSCNIFACVFLDTGQQ